ncbi:hypothetical protein [Roseococcus sp. YIM B11640]|uniref:hypothetical protein n=1 Tax=Roseococcus sp. YIM B11640 TaxID=3133973 RepID=UPI003C79EBBE
MRLHGIARRVLPVLMVALLWTMAPHAHALEVQEAGIHMPSGPDRHDSTSKASPCGVDCTACHPAALPPLGLEPHPSFASLRLGTPPEAPFCLGQAGDTPQRPPRPAATA